MQRCQPTLALGCCVGRVLNKKWCEIDVPIFRCPMQRRQPVLVLDGGGHVGATLDREPCEIDVAILQRPVQRS